MGDAPDVRPLLYQNVQAIFPDVLDEPDRLHRACVQMGQQLAHRLRADRMVACSDASVYMVVEPEVREEIPRTWWQRLLLRPRRYNLLIPEQHKIVAELHALPEAVAAQRG